MAADAPTPKAKADRCSVRWLCDRYLDRTQSDKDCMFRNKRGHV